MANSLFRSIWISDVHLGLPDCRAEALLQFLDATESEYLYLVGDIIDFQNLGDLRKRLYLLSRPNQDIPFRQ
jgi:UDP-2,3-diacylglucosamine pyrophosphatase LpxH